jgi:hypothetical protein
MNIVKFAECTMNMRLSNFQKDLLVLLESSPDGLQYCLKPKTQEVIQVKVIYDKWQQAMQIAV